MQIFHLTSGVSQPIPAGVYNTKINILAGSASVTYQVLDETPTVIPEFTVVANKDGTVELPACKITASLAGDASMIFSKIRD